LHRILAIVIALGVDFVVDFLFAVIAKNRKECGWTTTMMMMMMMCRYSDGSDSTMLPLWMQALLLWKGVSFLYRNEGEGERRWKSSKAEEKGQKD